MGRKSRQKGASGELQASRLLAAWWCGNPKFLKANAKDLPFRRTPMSGGWAKGKGLGGDLVVVDEKYKDFECLSVEVKNSEAWGFESIMRGHCSSFDSYLKQCRSTAKSENKFPLLMFTRNHYPWYVGVPVRGLQRLRSLVSYCDTPTVTLAYRGWRVFLFDYFTAVFSRKHFVRYASKWLSR